MTSVIKLGIDVGGTFTDIVLQLPDGEIVQAKTPSTPGEESKGVMAAIAAVGAQLGRSAEDILAQTQIINFGTTVATNAMLQSKGVAVGMITTRGFRDIIELRRGWKEVMFDIKLPPPPVIVPRRWRLGATERIGADGTIIVPLDEQEIRVQARRLRTAGIKSIAICFLFAFINPAHERRARDIVREEHPEAGVFLSSEVMPRIREYERFSTTVVNAYLSPLLTDYLRRLTDELAAAGFRGELFVMQSNGGSVSPDIAGANGGAALLSGPAAGVVAAARIGKVCNADRIIGVDMGGTSYDVSLIRGGAPDVREGEWFNRHYVGLPMLGIHTIGAGGGSIAWIDSGGALRVGPLSAGARPGPACYGQGGTQATVTDAFLCLGYLNPGNFLGGRIALDAELARAAVQRNVAEPLGMTLEEAAVGILRIVNNNMSNAIRYVSVARGHDPRDFVLMSFGGAGSVTAGTQARDLGIGRLLIPRSASVFCALGELWADLRVSQIVPRRSLADRVDLVALGAELGAQAEPYLERFSILPGVTETRVDRFAEFHYVGQSHEITTSVASSGNGISAEDWNATLENFHCLHRELYAFDLRHRPVEMLSITQHLIGVRPWTVRAQQRAPNGSNDALKARRRVCFEREGRADWSMTPIYDGTRLLVGDTVRGPAVIEEVDTTIVLQPGDVAVLTGYNVLDVAIDGSGAA